MRELPPRLSSMLNMVLLIASFLEKWMGSYYHSFRSCYVFLFFEQKERRWKVVGGEEMTERKKK